MSDYKSSSMLRPLCGRNSSQHVVLVTIVRKQTRLGIAGPKTLQDDVRRLLIPR